MKRETNADVKLPKGVSLSEWSLERKQWQNPRIRAFLGCIRVLDEVFESNYAILHSSPKRLNQMWEQVRKITLILKTEVAPLLKGKSHIPELEQARESADLYFNVLDRSLLESVESYPETLSESDHDTIRKLLCVAIGQLHAFLLDTLGEILARDPRSHSDTDYFLTRKFARDVDESEWLHTSVEHLEEYLGSSIKNGSVDFTETCRTMAEQGRIPTREEWTAIAPFLNNVSDGLVKRLKMILGLRGIRLSELELLGEHASNLPVVCGTLNEMHDAALSVLAGIEEHLETSNDEIIATRSVIQSVFSNRMLTLMRGLYDHTRDLTTFLPVWRQSIENRRALMLRGPRIE